MLVMIPESHRRSRIIHHITGTVRCQGEAFDSKTEVAAEEILYLRSAAEGMTVCQETIVGARTRARGKWVSLTVPIVVCSRKRISKPGTGVPFIVAVPGRRGCRSRCYFFGRKGLRTGISDFDKCKSDKETGEFFH